MSAIAPSKGERPTASAYPGEEPLFEIVDGEWLEIPPMSAFASILASRVMFELQLFARTQEIGQAVMETLFHLPLPVDRNRRPDVAFVSYERWPKNRPQPKDDNAWDVVPDLAVEVVSPHDDAEELQAKIEEYFRAKVRAVWVFYPKLQRCHVYESLSQIRVVDLHDVLDGGEVLPGLQLPLARLFLEESAAP